MKSARQYVNKWVWQYSNKTLFRDTEFEFHIIFTCQKTLFFFWVFQPFENFKKFFAHPPHENRQQAGLGGGERVACWSLLLKEGCQEVGNKDEDMLGQQKANGQGAIVYLGNMNKKSLRKSLEQSEILFGWWFTYILSHTNLQRELY